MSVAEHSETRKALSPDPVAESMGLVRPPLAKACSRNYVAQFSHKKNPLAERVARLACGCYSCHACCRRKAYAVAKAAGKAMANDAAEGLTLVLAVIPNDPKRKDANRKTLARMDAWGAAFCESVDAKQMLVVASVAARTKLHRDYRVVPLDEARRTFGEWANALPTIPPSATGKRGGERIGTRRAWVVRRRKGEGNWKKTGRVFTFDPRPVLDVLEGHGIEPRQKGSGCVWGIEWTWPEAWTPERIEAVRREVRQAQRKPATPDQSKNGTRSFDGRLYGAGNVYIPMPRPELRRMSGYSSSSTVISIQAIPDIRPSTTSDSPASWASESPEPSPAARAAA